MKDSCNSMLVKRVISPVTQTNSDSALVGQIIDRQGFESLTYVIATGGLTDANATFTVLLEESDASNMSGAVAVADGDMISQTAGTAPETAASFTFAADDNVRKLGYVGNRRYTRLTITPSGNDSGAAPIAAMAILGDAVMQPITQTAS